MKNTLLYFNPTPEVMDEKRITSYTRTNPHYGQKIIDTLSLLGEPFYVLALDGDNWRNRDIWIQGRKEDTFVPLFLYEKIEFKDCLFKFADEFLLFSYEDMTPYVEDMLKDKDYSVTTLVKKYNEINIPFMDFSRSIFKELKEFKLKGKGVVYKCLEP
jgi:hypothetical protein